MMDLEERLDRVEKKLDTLIALVKTMSGAARSGGASAGTPPSNSGAEIASDADLDSARGNPEVRFVPKRWTGADYRTKRYSDCEPEFLEMLAEALEWFAARDEESGATDKNGNPRAKWSRLDASRARGWALRKRGGPVDSGESAPRMVKAAAPRRPEPVRNGRATDSFGLPPGDEADIPF